MSSRRSASGAASTLVDGYHERFEFLPLMATRRVIIDDMLPQDRFSDIQYLSASPRHW